jgi:hypothetical protein
MVSLGGERIISLAAAICEPPVSRLMRRFLALFLRFVSYVSFGF